MGITVLQIHIHHDEGHYPDPKDKASWKPNYHVHIVWDWMNYKTGGMSRLQNMVSETLGMECGKSKSETGYQYLRRNDYIVAKQKREVEAAIAAKVTRQSKKRQIKPTRKTATPYFPDWPRLQGVASTPKWKRRMSG